MITLTAKINLLSGDNKALSVGTHNLSGNNISCDFGGVLGVKKKSASPFLLGVSKFGGVSSLSGNLDYFVGNQLSDQNGYFATPYQFTIKSENEIKSLSFDFDKINHKHPNSITIISPSQAEIVEKDDDPLFTIIGLEGAKEYTVKIDNWNSTNSPLVIMGIYVEVSIDIDFKNIISIDRSIFDRSDLKLPSFGIISNVGKIEFNDTDGQIRDYAEELLLQSGLQCEIKLNNTLVESAVERIGLFETDQWDYDNDSRVVSVSIKDDLEEWQEINVDEINYDPRNPESKPFSWLYYHLWAITTKNNNYSMQSFEELDSATKEILESTYIKYPLLESGSLWQEWTKLCQVCQLHIYKNNNGLIVCRYNGGN